MKGSYLKSASGVYQLILQQNGNLEIVCKNTSVWSRNTFGSDINSMRFDDFGIIGLRKSSSPWDVWSSMPGWQGSITPDSLIMQDDGNLRAFERELISNEKRQIFATISFGKCPAGNIFFLSGYAMQCVKSARIWSYSGPHFPEFGLNTERYSVFLRIQSECGKMRTRITPNTDIFYADRVMHVFKSKTWKHANFFTVSYVDV